MAAIIIMLIVSIIMIANSCKNCGAPLPGDPVGTFCCEYCGTPYRAQAKQEPEPSRSPDRVTLAGHRFRLEGRLGRGRSAEVYLARRDRTLTEMVLLKLAPAARAVALRAEWESIRKLRERDSYLARFLGAPLHWGPLEASPNRAPKLFGAAYRWRPGFCFNGLQALQQYPRGLDPRAVVWIGNRLLDQLIRLETLGHQHGALTLEHLLLHPRDHGVALCGWSSCGRGPGNDLVECGRCLLALLGPQAPPRWTHLLKQAPSFGNAQAFQKSWRQLALADFGPPRYHPFQLSALGPYSDPIT